jgi:flagellar biosynthesis GTPase FlhF
MWLRVCPAYVKLHNHKLENLILNTTGDGVIGFQQTLIGTLIIGLVVSLIFFFLQKGFLETHFFRDEAKSIAEQAKAEAYKAEALRQQEAAARAKAEAEAEQIKRKTIEDDNRRAQQQTIETEQLRQKTLQEEARRARIQAEIDAQQARQRAELERQAQQRRLQQAADAARIESANRARAYRAANGGCDLGSHRVCLNVGPSGGGPGGYQAGCACVGD